VSVGYPQEMFGRIAASDALPGVRPHSERAAPSIRGTPLSARILHGQGTDAGVEGGGQVGTARS
jgi:hypothetical protein